jgi:hypothetical protein
MGFLKEKIILKRENGKESTVTIRETCPYCKGSGCIFIDLYPRD